MTTKKVKALIVVRHWISDHAVKDNIEFETEIDTESPLAPDIQVAAAYTTHLCHETKVNKNPDYKWADAYVKAREDVLCRAYLEVLIVD